MYWIWKNDQKNKYIGFTHYHRYFYQEGFITKKEINDLLSQYDLIAPKPIFFDRNLYEQYKSVHYIKDLELACYEILKQDKTYQNSVIETLNQNKFYMGNLMITSKEILDDYLSFLFPILFQLEKQISYLSYSIYNQRVFGFLAERIFNIYVRKKKYLIFEYPVKDTLSLKKQLRKRNKILESLHFDNLNNQ